jgi:starvation-inducible DNA-binding protein
MNANIGLTQNELTLITPLLENFLASENILNLKIKNFHWNVTGIHFSDYHKFFEGLYDESAENIDEIAERIRMLGNKTQANMKFFLEKSFLTEETSLELISTDMVKSLLSDTEKTIQEMRNAIAVISETNDSWTEDFLIALMQKHEKTAWMLRSMVS